MSPPVAALVAALTRTRALLLDFDGPVCDVFAGKPAHHVASELRALLVSLGARAQDLDGDDDPLSLYARSGAYGRDVVTSVYAMLVSAERDAVVSASPTSGALETIQAARESGRHVAIVSNNAADAVLDYLNLHGIAPMVDHVAARRTPEPHLMKPNPRYVREAIDALSVEPDACTIVGDSATDVEAASQAGTRAIGYANKSGKVDHLAQAGADAVIEHMREMPDALAAARVW